MTKQLASPTFEFVTTTEAGQLLRLSAKSVRRLIAQDHLPAVRIPTPNGKGEWRIDKRDVLALLMGVR
jgi:excisionase family DNA binding protein